jgi:Acetyl-CoA dehydrogenase C-terminal like
MEQYVRDVRITQIYEGTNGIQALDLVGRKLGREGGRLLRRFFHPVSDYIEARSGNAELAPFVGPLAKAFSRLQQATGQVAQKGLANPDEAGAAASDYLRLFGFTALAFMWARMAETAQAKIAETGDPDGFYAAKVATARFFMERMLPQTSALFSQVMAGGRSIMALEEAAF